MIVPEAAAHDLLGRGPQPATEVGVTLQVVLLLILVGGLVWRFRDRPEWRQARAGDGAARVGLDGVARRSLSSLWAQDRSRSPIRSTASINRV
jgi:hypothetical protein